MKNITPLLAVVFVVACTPSEEIHTSIDGDRGPPGSIHNMPRGCYVMQHRSTAQYDCFGCVGGVCKDEDLNIWDYTDQVFVAQKGYRCSETTDGCILSER